MNLKILIKKEFNKYEFKNFIDFINNLWFEQTELRIH